MTPETKNEGLVLNIILGVLSLGFLMTFIDLMVMNVALPVIASDLGADINSLLWAVNSYALVVSALLISMGRLGDLIGSRLVFLIGLSVFTVASVGVGLSSTSASLIGFRALQGVGTAMLLPQNLAIIVQIVPAERRGATLGILGTVAGLAAIAGPAFGGLITSLLGWRWIFFINVPIAAIILPLAWIYLPKGKSGKGLSIDFPGTCLVATALVSLTYFLMEFSQQGWNALMIALVLIFVASSALLYLQQSRRQDRDPLIPFDVFKSPGFWPMCMVIAASSISIIGLVVIISIFLQSGQGYSAFYAGLSVVPASFVSMLLAKWSGNMSDRYPGRGLILAGIAIQCVGIALLVATMHFASASPPGTLEFAAMPDDFLWYLPSMIIIGTGNALTVTPTNAIAMREVSPELSGAASGIFNTIRQIGIVGAVTFSGIAINLSLGEPLDLEQQGSQAAISRALPFAMWMAFAAMLAAAAACLSMQAGAPSGEGEKSGT
jgi:EmrB/QacA subfamily drug resistance transporter